MPQLPLTFQNEMKKILGADYAAYEKCFDEEPYRGISLNRLKTTPGMLLPKLPFAVEKTPFYRDGYYLPDSETRMGNHPLHLAGAFYLQEPSATSAVSLLDPQPGERILDLCAAPGGKSAQISSCLGGSGLIWSNEVVRNRVQILLSNMERMGVRNGVVSSCYPEVLCQKLAGWFDRVLVDAPCSGEGMFRKNPEAITEWSREHVLACAERQLSILESAAIAVKEGGILVYSTCTFSEEENEGVILSFLKRHPEFEPCPSGESFGRPSALSCGIRITPLEGGEGHFAAKLRKTGETDLSVFPEEPDQNSGINEPRDKLGIGTRSSAGKMKRDSRAVSGKNSPDTRSSQAEQELSLILKELPEGECRLIGEKLFILPHGLPDLSGTGVIRAGILAGEWKKNRFEPAHALFLAVSPEQCRQVLTLHGGDPRMEAFLRGMEIDCDLPSGFTAVSYEGINLGFGKCSSSRLKNKYPKGLRIH